jgi:Immunoglobulin domain/Secretion system C-terminal sorting domain
MQIFCIYKQYNIFFSYFCKTFNLNFIFQTQSIFLFLENKTVKKQTETKMLRLKFPNTLLLLLVFLTISLNAQTIFVKPTGNGNGSSWAQAQGNLRQAIANAARGSQIWVAAGTYSPTNCATCTNVDRRLSFEIPDGVAVYGGFLGTETTLNQRNWKTNLTTLSGNIDGDTTIAQNSFNIIYTRNVTKTTLLDGFTIADGNANDTIGGSERTLSGGGWYNDGRHLGSFSHPSVKNCIFQNNRCKVFGSAMMNNGGYGGFCEPEYLNCEFKNNISGQEGGAVCNASAFNGACNPKFTFCQFVDNYSGSAGGAVFNEGILGSCNPVFTNCRFIRNQAGTYGGGIYNFGKSGKASPTITNCLFWGNKALSAAAVYCLGSENGNSSPRITNCVFYKNQANTCGSIYANANDATGKAAPIILNCIIWGNIATTAPYIRSIESYPIFDYSIIDAPNATAVYQGNVNGHGSCGSHVLYNQNPLFADPDNGDFRIIPPSPAINSGVDSAVINMGLMVDWDSFPRIVDGRVDMGIFEYNRSISYPPRLEQSPPSSTLCEREVVVLRALFSGSPPLYFQWYKNGIALPNETNDSLKFAAGIAIQDSGSYQCIVRNALDVKDSTRVAVLKIKPILPLSIGIQANRPPECEGDSIVFTTTWSNGGTSPKFDWQLNGFSLGLPDSMAVYRGAVKSIWFRYTCRITSSEQCAVPRTAISNELQYLSLLPLDTAVLTLVKTPMGTICAGDTVTFSSSAKQSGLTPQYKWYRNSAFIDNHSNVLKINNLNNNDTVKVIMVSSQKCLAKNPVESEKIVTTVHERLTPELILIANKLELCPKETVVFTANSRFMGATPQYQWKRNNLVVNNYTAIYSTDSLQVGDSIQVIAASSERCLTAPKVSSNRVKPKVNLCMGVFENTEDAFLISPNPSSESRFTLSGLDGFSGEKTVSVFTVNGQLLFSKKIENGVKSVVLDLEKTLSRGLYWVKIGTTERCFYKKWVLN